MTGSGRQGCDRGTRWLFRWVGPRRLGVRAVVAGPLAQGLELTVGSPRNVLMVTAFQIRRKNNNVIIMKL